MLKKIAKLNIVDQSMVLSKLINDNDEIKDKFKEYDEIMFLFSHNLLTGELTKEHQEKGTVDIFDKDHKEKYKRARKKERELIKKSHPKWLEPDPEFDNDL
jgi:hypothetical protein